MKQFFKFVFATMVGILLASILFVIDNYRHSGSGKER